MAKPKKKEENLENDDELSTEELSIIQAIERQFLEVDNEFLIRKDFIISIVKANNFSEDTYSIVIFHEALDNSLGMIWQRDCFKRATPEERDQIFEALKVELNG